MSHHWLLILETRGRANCVLVQVDQPTISTRVCSEMGNTQGGSVDQERQDSGLSQGLCEGIIGKILLHLWDPDAPVELF